MKFLECECCGFLAAIPKKDTHTDLVCPFCNKVKCEHGGKFVRISKEAFLEKSGLTPPAPDAGDSAPSQALSTPDMFSAIEHEPTPAPPQVRLTVSLPRRNYVSESKLLDLQR